MRLLAFISVAVMFAVQSPLRAADSLTAKSLVDARRSTSMPLIGNRVSSVGKNFAILMDDMEKGVVKATNGDYYLVLHFKQELRRADIEECCWIEDASGEKTEGAILVVKGNESYLGYYVSSRVNAKKLVFHDHESRIEIGRILK